MAKVATDTCISIARSDCTWAPSTNVMKATAEMAADAIAVVVAGRMGITGNILAVKIATWNVNSLRARLTRVVPWLTSRSPDVVLLQETKVVDEDFPQAEIEALGYHVAKFGQKTYNGVAIFSKHPITDVVKGLPDDLATSDKRVIAGTVNGMRVVSVYVPNGAEVGAEKYVYKLQWMARFIELARRELDRGLPLVVAGDWNIAPDDRDVYDPAGMAGSILCSEPERLALTAVKALGFEDAFRKFTEEGGLYTWWDYRAAMFRRGLGLRIDHVLVNAQASALLEGVDIDKEERKGEKPSDHAPVIARFRAP